MTKSIGVKLLKCPLILCGAENPILGNFEEARELGGMYEICEVYQITCQKCGLNISMPTLEEVIELWNTRPSAQWIKVEERLPEDTDWYEITWMGARKRTVRQCLLYISHHKKWYDSEDDSHDEVNCVEGVIAWKPKSEPYTPPSSTGAGE